MRSSCPELSNYQKKPYTTTILLLLMFTVFKFDSAKAYAQFRNGPGSIDETSKKQSTHNETEAKENWFEQKLDHFDKEEENMATCMVQLYYTNSTSYRNDSNAPIFLRIGGELAISPLWVKKGAWIQYAKLFGAMCFHLEHRFYGKSRPKSDLSLENLQFLSSRQALADVANFIQGMNREYKFDKTQKWIVFGGSYPGALAAWARQKYPHLIHGAISSSAPLLAIVDFVEYLEVVKASLATHSPSCPEAVGHAFAEIETLTHHEIGQRNLDEKFNTCTPIRDSVANSLDMSNFFETLTDNIASVVQLNRNNTSAGHSLYNIEEICDVMVNTTIGPPVARLGIVSGMLLEKSEEKCFDYKYDKKLEVMRNISWEAKAANWTRQWTYQTCNEFGYFQTSNKKNDTFGDRFKVDFFIKQCMDIYSESMDAKYLERVVSQTNEYYGGLRPNTTNMLYVHGSIDPWHALGLTSSVDPNVPTIYIEGTAHCADMYDQAETDPPQLVEAREKTRKFIEQLLNKETNEISKFL